VTNHWIREAIMAELTIGRDHVGVYEVPLAAGDKLVVNVDTSSDYNSEMRRVSVMQHDGMAPVYCRLGREVEVKDPKSTIVPPLSLVELMLGSVGPVAVISAAATTVSVFRS
jgi:hypothetical protein